VKKGAARIEPLRWTIPDYFYAKSVALVAGKRSGGKSLFIAWFAGMATRGRYIDQRGHEKDMEPQNVLINVVAEDPVEEFWNPRLKLAGADFNRVKVTEKHYLLPASLGSLREDLLELRSGGFNVDILILESLSTHVKNPYYGFERNRQAMSGLVTLAETFDLTVVLAHHFRKGKGHTVESAIGGQGVLQNSSKAIYVVSPFPHANATTRVLACERINGAMPTSLQFELQTKHVREAKSAHPFLKYIGPIDVTARDVYNASRDEKKGSGRTGVEIVAAFIHEHLKDGQIMKLADLEEAARAAEVWFSKGTFERARNMAGLRTISNNKARELLGSEFDFVAGDADGRTQWVKLPKQAVGEELLPNDGLGRTLISETETFLRNRDGKA
jgi:hypothetical protein